MLLSDVCLSGVCLSVEYIGPKSRTERSRKTKIGHVTHDSDTISRSNIKVTRPIYSHLCWRIKQLQQWAWKCVGREKLLTLPFARLREALRRPWRKRGAGNIVVAARLELVNLYTVYLTAAVYLLCV